MSYFEPVDVRLWGDKNFRALSKAGPNGQTLWMYLITGPHNRGLPGLFNLGSHEIAQRLGWQPGDVVAVAKEELIPRGMLEADWEAMVIFLPKVFNHKPPQSTNNVLGWMKLWDGISESVLKIRWAEALAAYAENAGDVEILETTRLNFLQGPPTPPPGGPPTPPPPGGGPPPPGGLNRTTTTPTTTPKRNPLPAEAAGCACLLREMILENEPKAKVPAPGTKQFEKWVQDIERIHRIDGRSWEEIENIIGWCQEDSFWRSNILCGSTLRKQFTRLVLASQHGRGKKVSGNKRVMDSMLKNKEAGRE